MANWPAFSAGSARITLKPRLSDSFKTDTKLLLKPINEKLTVTVSPKLVAGFKTDLRSKVKTASDGINPTITFRPDLAKGFKTDLREKVRIATAGTNQTVLFAPKLATGFKASLRTAVNTSLKDYKPTITFRPELRDGFRADLKMAVGGVKSHLRSETLIEFRPALAKGFRADLKTKLTASAGTLRPKVPVDVDLTQATAQLEAFRLAQAAIPLTMNVNIDMGAAMAQLLALRTLVSAIGQETSAIGATGLARSATRLTGNIFTRPIRAIKIQIEVDKASVARAEAEVANVRARLEQAQRSHGDATDNTRLAQERYNEVMARSTSTDSQKMAALQRLTRARRTEADQLGRVTGLMNEQRDADTRLDRARNNRGSLARLFMAGASGLGSALADAGKSMLSFRNLTTLATAGLVALAAVSLIPLIGQIVQAAGVLGLIPAALTGAAAVIGTLVIGTRGLGDAFSAASKAAENATEDAEAHAKAVASAQKAQVSAARSVAQAERGITTAERGVRDAQKNSLKAQQNLTKARKQAKQDLDDLNRALGRTALTEETAAIAVARAQQQMFEVFSDPNSDALDRAEAQNSVKQALADQQDTILENQRLAEKAAEANALGVENSDEVVSAKEAVTAAAEAEGDAQQALADAYTNLADAQASYAEATRELTDAINDSSSSVDEYEKALGRLSPAARDFVEKMRELSGPFGELRSFVQQNLFDQLGTSVQNLATNYLPTLREGLGGIASAINEGVRKAIADLDTDANRLTLANIFKNVEESVTPFLTGLGNVLQAFLALSEVGSEFMPGAATSFEDATKRFKDWANSDEGKTKFRDFLRESIRTFKDLWNIGKQVFDLFGNIFKGADETGESWLTSISETLKRWNDSLSTEEGQEKLKEFFKNVRITVNAITTMITAAIGLVDKLSASPLGDVMGVFDENKSGGEKAKSLGGGLLRGAVEYGPIGWTWKAIGGTDKVKESWDSFTKDIRDEAGTVVGKLYEFGTGFTNWADTAEDALNTRIGGALTGFSTNLVGVSTSFTEFGSDMSSGFDNLKTKISDVFDEIRGPKILGAFKSDMDGLPGFFDSLVNGIGSTLSTLAQKFQGPINAVVDVLNGFGDIWNKVAKKIGLPEWEPLEHVQGTVGSSGAGGFSKPVVGARASGGPGGPVHGPGNGRDDRAGLYRLSRGEHVWTADEVRAAGGHEAMYKMRNSVLSGGGTQSRGDGFSDGGGVVSTSDPLDPIQVHLWDLVRSAIPSAILTSGKRFADVGAGFDYHMQGKAIDLAGPMDSIAKWIYDTYPQSAELIHWPLNGWQNINDGAPFDFGSSTNSQHADHVHWAADGFLTQLSDAEKQSLFDRVRSGIGSMFSGGKSFLIDNLLAKPLRGLADNVPDIGGLGEFGQIPKAFARKMADTVIRWVTEKFGSSGGSGEPVDYDPSWGVEHWREMAREAMRRVGFDADNEQQVNAMLAQIKSESGGNPNIAQQITDINGTGEQAGVGLLQVIPSTYEAYRDPELPNNRRDPFSNMVAALRYYRNRYGMDLTQQWGHGHGYAQGGWVNGPGGPLADKIRAMLSNGEFVVNAASAKQFGPLLEMINAGGIPQAQSLVQPLTSAGTPNTNSGNPANFAGTNPDGTPGSYGVPINPGVDTMQMVGEKAKERFTGAFQTGFNDLVSSTLDPLGLPDPRNLIPGEVTAYGQTLDSWHKARIASAQASAALSNSGYQAAAAPATGAANQVIRTSGSGGTTSMTSIDNSTHITLQTRDVDEAYRRAQQIADLRAIPNTSRG